MPSDVERSASTTRVEFEGQRPIAPSAAAGKSNSWLWAALAVLVGYCSFGCGRGNRDAPEAAGPGHQPARRAAAGSCPTTSVEDSPNACNRRPQVRFVSVAPAELAGDQGGGPGRDAGRSGSGGSEFGSPDTRWRRGPPCWSLRPTIRRSQSSISDRLSGLRSRPRSGQPATVAVKADADIP